jgi:hypothetical protein
MSFSSIFRSKGFRRTCFVLAIPLALGALYMWRLNPLALGRPTDGELVAIFREHREAFERLRTMALEDSRVISYVSEDSLQKSGLSEARRAEYVRLLSGIRRNLTAGVSLHGVTFRFAGGGVGLAIARSWVEGITYLSDGSEKGCVIVKSLDDLGAHISDGVYLVPIDRNWYLEFSQLD